MGEWLSNFGDTINNSFFFVVDKIIDLQKFFIGQAWTIGKVVFFIALLSAGLNHAITGQGLKENIIKIMKATLFFMIVTLAYPKIIGFICSWTYDMAFQSIYPSVESQFKRTWTVTNEMQTSVDIGNSGDGYGNLGGAGNRFTFTRTLVTEVTDDAAKRLFPNLSQKRKHPVMEYSSIAPAAIINLIFVLSSECFKYGDDRDSQSDSLFPKVPDFGRILKGFICAFFIILTGVFALLEYLMCFLEFMLVASVGVILFPLSIWEGSKFMSEKYIGAIIGFFIKLLFCSIAICLMIYGFTCMFFIISAKDGFSGTADQIIYIVFGCLLFFYICKSAPGIAQSLLTGTPSLSATGAISAAGGALAAAGATMGAAKAAGGMAKSVAGGMAKAGLQAHGALSEAGAAAGAAKTLGGSGMQQAGAFMSSLAGSAKDSISAKGLGLARSIMGGGSSGGGSGSGGGSNPHSWNDSFTKGTNKNGEQKTYGEHIQERKAEGRERGLAYMTKQEAKNNNAGGGDFKTGSSLNDTLKSSINK